MDRIPAKLPNTASRLIAMAASLVGESGRVMEHMKCSAADFREYTEGRKERAWPEYERLIDLIVREQKAMIAKNRALLRAHRAKREK